MEGASDDPLRQPTPRLRFDQHLPFGLNRRQTPATLSRSFHSTSCGRPNPAGDAGAPLRCERQGVGRRHRARPRRPPPPREREQGDVGALLPHEQQGGGLRHRSASRETPERRRRASSKRSPPPPERKQGGRRRRASASRRPRLGEVTCCLAGINARQLHDVI